jgi:hypothetical protein
MKRMFYGAAAAALATVAVLAFASTAEARWMPGGSYRDTCVNVSFDGDLLTARCQRVGRGWKNTWLRHADDCDGNIANDDGQLVCDDDFTPADTDHSNDGGPSGYYERSCNSIHMDGYTLRAMCRTRSGSWRWTSLDDAYDCDGHIANRDGQLYCR